MADLVADSLSAATRTQGGGALKTGRQRTLQRGGTQRRGDGRGDGVVDAVYSVDGTQCLVAGKAGGRSVEIEVARRHGIGTRHAVGLVEVAGAEEAAH